MTSIVQTIQHRRKTTQSLPISTPSDDQPTLRRRLSSLSLKLHPSISGSPTSSWPIHRSNSLSSMADNAGSSIKRWWDSGWTWIISRKLGFFQDLEMNEQEKHAIGFQDRGSLRHLFFKLKSEIRKLLRYDDNLSLPQSFKYDHQSFNCGIRRVATLG